MFNFVSIINPELMANKPAPQQTISIQDSFDKLLLNLVSKPRITIGKLIALAVLLYIILHKDIAIDLEFNHLDPNTEMAIPIHSVPTHATTITPAAPKPTLVKQSPDNTANTFSNLPKPNDSEEQQRIKRRKKQAYIRQYAPIAVREMRKTGIPASITLAQGLLESNAGESRLAIDNNNHFGIKCFSRLCKKGHCTNFTDDTHKDFFRKYANPDQSFAAHSDLLRNARYKFLFQYRKNDYKKWARGLKSAGYATDPNYGDKLINLIEDLKLYQYD